MSFAEKMIEKEIKQLDYLVDFYIYEDPQLAEKYMWMREALRKLLKRYKDELDK